ncbi:MAG TPA: type I DNA topoisomerase [Steroidobacteraceae bacterium]|jgi:DNA topoisomerase-1|nr:type I DNA topoisomerase [Steroidobacteraceae bacterium]
MSSNLVIVESPAKAKTIKKYLGPDFEVLASYGHVRDLIEKEGAVNPDRDFEMKYQLIDKSKPKVDAIQRAMKKADALYLATDPDREGEAISWHLSEILREQGALDGKDLRRVRFYEITKNAVREAVEQAESGINENLVNAYKARRALDYLVGFNLSPLLWKKIKPGLSAGRVQSVALRLICEREAEIQKFERQEYWTVEVEASKESARFPSRLTEFAGEKFEADVQKGHFTVTNEPDARRVERALQDQSRGWLTVESVERRPKRRNPPPPFTTSTLQQEAARKLGFTARRTMQTAQRLYEAGYITYMRTDSVNLSNEAVREIRAMIKSSFGDKALSDGVNEYKTKSKNAQEAHEAIRPTDAAETPQKAERDLHEEDQRRLYALVWKRAVACQMAPAVFDTVAVDLVVGDPKAATGANRHVLRATGQTLLEPGFLAAYHEDHDEDETDVESEDEQRLPALEAGERVELQSIRPEQHFTQPPPRYTEASLVKSLESHGIGRPSTYASIIETLRYRRYVEMSGRAFVPTDIGKIVSKFLVKYLGTYVDYGFTALMEDALDEISNGEKAWNQELGRFWKPFRERVEHIGKTVTREEVAESREVGKDPASGKPISVRMGQYGPFVQCGTRDDPEKPRFASLLPGQHMDDVTLADALKLLSLPRDLGQAPDGTPISVGRGQYGPYVKYGAKYASIKEDDPFTLELPRALEIVAAKVRVDAERTIQDFPEAGIQVLKGRYGPYVTDKKRNAKVPKDREPASLTLEECQALLAAAPERKGRFGRRAKAPAPTAADAQAPAAAPKAPRARKKAATPDAGDAKPAKKAARRKPAAKKPAGDVPTGE